MSASPIIDSLVTVLFAVWSYIVSYVAVRTRFEVRLWAARVWFLILPVVVLVAVSLLGVYLGVLRALGNR